MRTNEITYQCNICHDHTWYDGNISNNVTLCRCCNEVLSYISNMGPQTASEIALETQHPLNHIEHILSFLVEQKEVRATGFGTYELNMKL